MDRLKSIEAHILRDYGWRNDRQDTMYNYNDPSTAREYICRLRFMYLSGDTRQKTAITVMSMTRST